VNLVRACDYAPFPSPWGQARTLAEGEELHVTKAAVEGAPADAPPGTVGEPADSAARVAAADGWVLVSRMTAAGRRVRPAEVLRPGLRLNRP
jgi:UDP-4-amino-4-deoxy-L-arabinose formyltransferase/UDP-glucuronic acid dehydrogenase (UDP-4-keto-hexauronic acid decarboxylating)